MRSLLVAFLLTALASRAADVEFLRVWPGWRDAQSFERISEYFGEPEQHGKQIVLRTKAGDRAGYYFVLRVKTSAPIENAHFDVDVIRPDSPMTKKFTFPAALPARESVVQLGVTGADWPEGRNSHPVAWRVSLVSGDGQVLAEHKSFLWEKPAK